MESRRLSILVDPNSLGGALPLGSPHSAGASPQRLSVSGVFCLPGASCSAKSFSVGNAVKCWRASSNEWMDAKVVITSDAGVTVQFQDGPMQKLIPHESVASVLVPLQASDLAAGEQVSLWSASNKTLYKDAAITAVTSEGVHLAYNGGQMIMVVPPNQVHQVIRKNPRAHPSAGPLADFAVGDQVALWSESNNTWFDDGTVTDVTCEGVTVTYNGGHLGKIVLPSQVRQFIRRIVGPGQRSARPSFVREVDAPSPLSQPNVDKITNAPANTTAVLMQHEGYPDVVLRKTPGGAVCGKVPNDTTVSVLRYHSDGLALVRTSNQQHAVEGWCQRSNMLVAASPPPVGKAEAQAPSLATSNFKLLYDAQGPVKFQDYLLGALRKMLRGYATEVGDTEEHADETLEMLQGQALNCKHWEALCHCDHMEIAKVAIVLWTSADGRTGLKKPFCQILNHVLRRDSGDALKPAVVFTRAMTTHMVNHARGEHDHSRWPENQVSYRGTRMPRKELDFFVKDKLYRVPMFLGTSFYEKQAYIFLRNVPESELVPVMFRFVLDPVLLCDHAMYIEGMSQLHDEHELLYAPYSAFRVISVEIPEGKITWDKPAIILIGVQPNNASVPEDLPLAPWH